MRNSKVLCNFASQSKQKARLPMWVTAYLFIFKLLRIMKNNINTTEITNRVANIIANNGLSEFVMPMVEFLLSIFEAKSYTQFGWRIATLTTPSNMRKRGNPYTGRVQVLTCYDGRQFADYSSVVASRTTDGEYTATDMGYETLIPRLLDTKTLKDGTTNVYLRLMEKSQDSVVKKYYLLDNEIVTDSKVIEEIKSFIPKKDYSCKKQLQAGVSEDKQVKFQRIKLDNVLCLHQNADHTITNLSREIVITPNDLKRMLAE